MGDDGGGEAAKAAAEAGLELELADTVDVAVLASDLFARVWPKPSGEPAVPSEVVWALAHAGNYVVVARRGGEVVGASLAFRGVDGDGPLLHSHVTGVLPGLEGRHVGFALKLHQRAWALAAGIRRVTWTFDPLVARNAYFNVTKLGASVTAFHPEFYDVMGDAINQGDPSDRCVATWDLLTRRPPRPIPDAPVVLEAGTDGRPQQSPRTGDTVICRMPADIVALRHTDPDAARGWRAATRAVLADAYGGGLQIVAADREHRYLLARP